MAEPDQPLLFDLPPQQIESVPPDPEHVKLAAALPAHVRLGGMSWSYPGWRGLVYGARTSQEAITSHGLTAYGKHPLLRIVELDRSYYEPLSAQIFASYAAQVPADFRFFVKAHEEATVERFPAHARYGKRRGELNPRYLDAGYVEDQIVGPTAEGLGSKLGAILFQFPPHEAPRPSAFADELHAFLQRLPKGPLYAVELRNAALLTRPYAQALIDSGAVHCHNAWTAMPDVVSQAKSIPPRARAPLLIRWLLRRGDVHEAAERRSQPFTHIVAEDSAGRDSIARLVAKAAAHGVEVDVLVANIAEGCAPLSIADLARAILKTRSG